jgi:hypothetical protein
MTSQPPFPETPPIPAHLKPDPASGWKVAAMWLRNQPHGTWRASMTSLFSPSEWLQKAYSVRSKNIFNSWIFNHLLKQGIWIIKWSLSNPQVNKVIWNLYHFKILLNEDLLTDFEIKINKCQCIGSKCNADLPIREEVSQLEWEDGPKAQPVQGWSRKACQSLRLLPAQYNPPKLLWLSTGFYIQKYFRWKKKM